MSRLISICTSVSAARWSRNPASRYGSEKVTFGVGAMAELGAHARHLGMSRVALFTDPRGWVMIGVGLTSLSVGMFVMSKMVKFEI